MNDERSAGEGWDSCKPGELRKLAAQLRWRRRDRKLAKVVGVAGALIVLLFIGVIAMRPSREPLDYGGISCRETLEHIRPFAAGQLDADLTERIRVHLELCPNCGPLFRRMIAEMQQTVAFLPGSQSEPACGCGHCSSSWRSSLLTTVQQLTDSRKEVDDHS